MKHLLSAQTVNVEMFLQDLLVDQAFPSFLGLPVVMENSFMALNFIIKETAACISLTGVPGLPGWPGVPGTPLLPGIPCKEIVTIGWGQHSFGLSSS